jgi:hypothetical protein
MVFAKMHLNAPTYSEHLPQTSQLNIPRFPPSPSQTQPNKKTPHHSFSNKTLLLNNQSTMPIMIMHRTPSRLLIIPIPNTLQVEPAKALQPSHILPNHILFEANTAFRVLDQVFL